MDKFPLLYEGRPIGELTVRREGEDTLFSVLCRLPGKDLWCLWAVGQGGTLRLGCPEQQSGEVRLSRRFSGRMTAPLGPLHHGELRKAVQPCGWEEVKHPAQLFHTPSLGKALQGCQGVLTKKKGDWRLLALPFSPEKPFPLVSLFCFAHLRKLREGTYIVYAFDGEEWPLHGNF